MSDTEPTIQDSQNYKINIDQIYNDFIKSIDEIRSYVNIGSPSNANLLKNITKDTFTGNSSNGGFQPEKTAQESRCHAFFRIIGFPVVSSDNRIYNPGHDIIIEKDRKLNIESKISIANNPLNGFQKLSDTREQYINGLLKIFANNKSTDAGVLALSGINFRPFTIVFEKNSDAIEDPFDKTNQAYEISSASLVGANDKITFFDYIDKNDKSPEKYSGYKQRQHIIKPFIVDPRIDLSTPSYQKVAVPFVKDDTQLKIDDVKSVKRPLIEKVIRDRFSTENQASKSGSLAQETIDAIKNISAIKDEKIVQDVTSGQVYGLSEKQQFVKYLNIIRAMISELYAAKKTIRYAQSQYYWLPIPAVTGPEDGCTIHPLFPNCYYDDKIKIFNTEADFGLLKCQYRAILDSINASAASVTAAPDPAGYALGKFTTTFDDTTSTSLGDTNAEQQGKLEKDRTEKLTEAGKALKVIEIIMGEISGLGLCDMVAIMGGLYLMPANSLLGFLDDDAYTRAKLYIKSLPETNPADIKTALNDLSKNVKSLYDIMQKISENFEKTNISQ